jgi:hypothetical protein
VLGGKKEFFQFSAADTISRKKSKTRAIPLPGDGNARIPGP